MSQLSFSDVEYGAKRKKTKREIFALINQYLSSQGLRFSKGSIVDATIIEAPSSTKNATGTRDPEMHQTKKGNSGHFGMKAHIGGGC